MTTIELQKELGFGVYARDVTRIQKAIKAGATPNTHVHLHTPLIWAATMGSWECIYALLDAGADINAKSVAYGYEGRTALMAAAIRGYSECVILLLDAGADRQAKDACGYTALDYARMNKREECAGLIETAMANAGESVPERRTNRFKIAIRNMLGLWP